MNRKTLPIVAMILGGLALPGLAQQNAELALKINEARRQNAAMMKNYAWSSRIEFVEKGKVEDVRLDSVSYGPDGKLQRTTVNDQSAPLPGGFLRKKIAEEKKEKMEQYLTGLRGVLEQYTLPTAGKMVDFVDAAQMKPAGASLQIAGANAVQQGDTLTLTIDGKTLKSQSMQVSTTYDGSVATLSITFKTNRAGLTYPAYAEVTVPDKEITLQVHNYDYESQN